jgi:flagellar hook-basal body complex protein FliE
MVESIVSSGGFANRAYGMGTSLSGEIEQSKITDKGQQTFVDMVEEATKNSVQNIKQADIMAQKGLAGEVTTQQVVQATMQAEASLKTVAAVRDKVVQAYQQILRMPI